MEFGLLFVRVARGFLMPPCTLAALHSVLFILGILAYGNWVKKPQEPTSDRNGPPAEPHNQGRVYHVQVATAFRFQCSRMLMTRCINHAGQASRHNIEVIFWVRLSVSHNQMSNRDPSNDIGRQCVCKRGCADLRLEGFGVLTQTMFRGLLSRLLTQARHVSMSIT